MPKKATKKDLNPPKAVEKNSRGKLKPLNTQDSPKMEQLQSAFEKLKIDGEKPTRKKRASTKLAADKNLDEKMRNDATMKKKSVGNNKSSGLGESDGNKNQRKPLENETKRKYVPGRSNKKNMEKPSDENKNPVKISNDTVANTNEPTTSDKNHKASPIPMRAKRRVNSSNKISSKKQDSSVNKDLDTNKIIIPKGQNIVEERARKIKNPNKSREINKTYVIPGAKNEEKLGIIEPEDKINFTNGKEIGRMNLPSKTNSPVIAHVKRENKSSPQSPIAVVSRHSYPTPPAAANGKSVDIKKYEKFFSVGERNVLIPEKEIKKEKNVEKVLGNIGVNGQASKTQLSGKNLEGIGCSSMESTFELNEEQKGKPQANDTKKNGKKDSCEKSACNSYEERRETRKEKKLAEAFEKLGKRFVSTAKKMGYLNDSTEDSSTDDSEDYSEHSTDCSCSSCTSCSDCSSRSSDDFSEFTVSGSSSYDSTSDSSID